MSPVPSGGYWWRGEAAIARDRCGCCDVVPRVGGATGRVGLGMSNIGTQAIPAGRLSNDPALLAAFVPAPQEASARYRDAGPGHGRR